MAAQFSTEALDSEVTLGGATLPAREAATSDVELRCARGLVGLTALQRDWESLSPLLRDPRFHHQYAWQHGYLSNLETDPHSVHYFSFHRNGRAVAIFPLRRAQRIVAGMRLRVWELPHEPHMDLCDALVAQDENCAELLFDLVRALELRLRDYSWDALHLPRLLDGSLALRALQAAPLSFVTHEAVGQSMHFDCRSIEAALRNASPQFARNLRRQRRKLDRFGPTEVALVREPGALEAALEDFLRIEASGWKGASGSAIVLHREVEAFYRDLTQRFGAEGRCSINLLRLSGTAIAAQYCLIEGRRMNLLKIAYDQTYAAEAPGSRLLHDVLSWCCESAEIDELSLVTGPSWAPGRWNPETVDVRTACVFNATPRGMAAYLATRFKPVFAEAKTLLLSE